MPEQVRCPSCNSALRVPESLLGKNVKCPRCATTFIADVEELAQPEGIVRESTPEASRQRWPEDAEDEGFPSEEEDEDRPRRRQRRRSYVAESAVSGPAIALMVSASLGMVCNIGYLIFRLLSEIFVSVPALTNQPGYWFGFIGAITAAIIGVLMSIMVLIGAVKMKKLRNYGLALTSSILSMLSPTCCCFLGLPFGIWALVVLNNPDVKRAFS
jgi:predicted Zn finger-like uncharacterized protein